MTDVMTPAQRSRCMGRIRSRDTKPELALRKQLFSRGLRYRTTLRLPGKPDLVFPAAKLVVFVDGCFWHGCPVHGTSPKSNRDYWTAKLRRNMERDAEVTRALGEEGWRVLRFWEHEVANELSRVADEIVEGWRSLKSAGDLV